MVAATANVHSLSAGIPALEEMSKRLAEDHSNAQLLARGLASLPNVDISPDLVCHGSCMEFGRCAKQALWISILNKNHVLL